MSWYICCTDCNSPPWQTKVKCSKIRNRDWTFLSISSYNLIDVCYCNASFNRRNCKWSGRNQITWLCCFRDLVGAVSTRSEALHLFKVVYWNYFSKFLIEIKMTIIDAWNNHSNMCLMEHAAGRLYRDSCRFYYSQGLSAISSACISELYSLEIFQR